MSNTTYCAMPSYVTEDVLERMLTRFGESIRRDIKHELTVFKQDVKHDLAVFKRDIDKRLTSVESKVEDIEFTLINVKNKVKDIETKIDLHHADVEYIRRNYELGTYRKRSFWKDNWYMSTLMIPIIQCFASYFSTFGPKKND